MYGAFSGDAPNVMKNASFLILVLFCLMKVFIAGQIPSQIGVPMIIKSKSFGLFFNGCIAVGVFSSSSNAPLNQLSK